MISNKLYLIQQSYKENIEAFLNPIDFLNEISLMVNMNIQEVYSLLEDPIFLKVLQKKCQRLANTAIDAMHKEQYTKLADACKKQRKKPVDKARTHEFYNSLIAIHFFKD